MQILILLGNSVERNVPFSTDVIFVLNIFNLWLVELEDVSLQIQRTNYNSIIDVPQKEKNRSSVS